MPTLPDDETLDNYLGIDPGKSGGLALIRSSLRSNQVLSYSFMPESDYDLYKLLRDWKNTYGISSAVLERVSSMPGEGHVGAFSFGENYGKLQMALAANKIRYEKITPRVWQKGLGVKVKAKTESKPAFKERLRQLSQQLFPSLPLWDEPRTLGKQRAVCDAILIGEYCKRKEKGLL